MATVKELRAKAKGLFFKGYSKMNKAELEKLISDYEASEEAFRDIDPSIHAPEATTQPEQPQPTPSTTDKERLLTAIRRLRELEADYAAKFQSGHVISNRTRLGLMPEIDNLRTVFKEYKANTPELLKEVKSELVEVSMKANGISSKDYLCFLPADIPAVTEILPASDPKVIHWAMKWRNDNINIEGGVVTYADYFECEDSTNAAMKAEKTFEFFGDCLGLRFALSMPSFCIAEALNDRMKTIILTQNPNDDDCVDPKELEILRENLRNSDDDDPDPTPPSNRGESPTQNTKGKKHPVGIVRYPDGRIKSKFDFSTCRDEKRLREMFKGASIETLEYVARSFEGFSAPKRVTKAFCIDFITGLYFPPKPKEATPKEAPKSEHSILFTQGAIYIKGYLDGAKKANLELVKVLKRNGDYVTVQEISYPDFEPIFRPERKRIHVIDQANMNILHECITLKEYDEEGNPQKVYVHSFCEYCAESPVALKYDADYYLSVCPKENGEYVAKVFDEIREARANLTVQEQPSAPQPEVVAVQDVTPEVKPEPEVLPCGDRVVGEYTDININDKGEIWPCGGTTSFAEEMCRYFLAHPTRGNIKRFTNWTRSDVRYELDTRCRIEDLWCDFCYYPIKIKGLRKAEIIENIINYADKHGLLKPEIQEVKPDIIRVEFSQPESVVEQDTTEAPTIETSPATEPTKIYKFVVGNVYGEDRTSSTYIILDRKGDWITYRHLNRNEKPRRRKIKLHTYGTRDGGKFISEELNNKTEYGGWIICAYLQQAKTETWQEHSCDHCKPEKHLWSKEQFYRGMCLIFDCENNPDYRYKSLTAYLLDTYTLTELWKLARYFALNVPKIELNSKNRTLQKSIQIAYLLADMLLEMDHVFTATYIVINPPELPNELKGKLSTIRQEMYDRNVHKQPEQPATVEETSPATPQATAEQAPKVKASAPKPKPRKRRKRDIDTRTLSLSFDEDNPTEISSQVAISNHQSNTQKSTAGNQSSTQSSTTKHRRKPRVKYNDSRQILIGFDVEILSGESDQRQAA